MLFLDDHQPLFCQRRIYHPRSYCSLIHQIDKNKLYGIKRPNGANQSRAMQFSRYAQYQFSRSEPIPTDLCKNGNIQHNNYIPHIRVPCTNPIFSDNWTSKSNHCSCIIGKDEISY